MSNSSASPVIQISVARASHRYQVGEVVKFQVQCQVPQKVQIELSCDGGTVLEAREVQIPAAIPGTLSVPGFLRCTITAPGSEPVLCGVVFEPERIRPAGIEPADFDEFWQRALARFDGIPTDLKLHCRSDLSTNDYKIYELSCGHFDGSTIYGFLKLPQRPHPVPLLVYFEGAGPGQSMEFFNLHCQTALKHLGSEIACLTIATHDFKPREKQDDQAAYFRDYVESHGGSYWLQGLTSGVEHTFFYQRILGAVRLCNLVSQLPEIDRERIAYLGVSQGGGFGMYLTALCPQIKAASCGVPAFGDIAGGVAGGHQPQSHIPEFKQYAATLNYFDAAWFARRIQVPVFISLGYIDTACSPGSVMAIANSLGGRKLVFHKVEHGHRGGPVDYEQLLWFYPKTFLVK